MPNTTYTPFVLNTASDYDMSPGAVQTIYDKYGSTPSFYDKLEEYIKDRSK